MAISSTQCESDRESKKLFTEEYFADKDGVPVHLVAALDEIIEQCGFQNILEVGCGTGRLLNGLRKEGRRIEGCDLSLHAAKRAGAQVADATRLPYKRKQFDFVIAVSVIEHLREEQGDMFIDEAARVLRHGGCLFMVTPNFSSPLRYIKGQRWFGYSDPTHVQFYTPRSLARKMERFGFSDIELRFSLKRYPDFNWGLPIRTPGVLNRFLSWLLISSPAALIRDSFWIMGKYVGSTGVHHP